MWQQIKLRVKSGHKLCLLRVHILSAGWRWMLENRGNIPTEKDGLGWNSHSSAPSIFMSIHYCQDSLLSTMYKIKDNLNDIFLCFCVFVLEEFGEVKLKKKKKKTVISFHFLFRRWLTVPRGNGSSADWSWAVWLLVFPVKQQISTNPCIEKLARE